MQLLFTLLFATMIVATVSECVLEFDKHERDCVLAFKYPVEKILKYYNKGYPAREDINFNLFVECLWHKRRFLDESGNIKYNSVKNTNRKYFHVTGVCDDVPLSAAELTKLYRESVDQCERDRQADYRAETVRSCIAKNYKKRLPIIEKEEEEEEDEESEEEKEKEKQKKEDVIERLYDEYK